MLLSRIPVRVIADNPHEMQAFAEVLGGGQAGALVLAGADENAMVSLVCPSGDVMAAAGRPMLVLGARRESADMEGVVRSLAVPANLSEILVGLEKLAQDAADITSPRSYAGWHLDPARQVIEAPDGRLVGLTDTETRLLAMLFEAQGESLEKEELLNMVWGYRPGLDTHTLETHIYRLRQKIETNPTSPSFLMTTENGYRLV